MTNVIEAAIAPLKADAIAYGEEQGYKVAERFLAKLGEFDGDMREFAPYPGSYGTRKDFAKYEAKRGLMSALTISDPQRPSTGRVNSPEYRVRDEAKIARFIKDTGVAYGVAYDRFVDKLVAKVGECVSASIDGNHVWGHSILSVTKADGSIERWKTQTILNFSVHGTPFNQWPTRKVK